MTGHSPYGSCGSTSAATHSSASGHERGEQAHLDQRPARRPAPRRRRARRRPRSAEPPSIRRSGTNDSSSRPGGIRPRATLSSSSAGSRPTSSPSRSSRSLSSGSSSGIDLEPVPAVAVPQRAPQPRDRCCRPTQIGGPPSVLGRGREHDAVEVDEAPVEAAPGPRSRAPAAPGCPRRSARRARPGRSRAPRTPPASSPRRRRARSARRSGRRAPRPRPRD